VLVPADWPVQISVEKWNKKERKKEKKTERKNTASAITIRCMRCITQATLADIILNR